jgi:hypothetical protein
VRGGTGDGEALEASGSFGVVDAGRCGGRGVKFFGRVGNGGRGGRKGSPPYTPLDFSLLFLAFDWLSLSPPVAVARQNGKVWEISTIHILHHGLT